MTGSIRYPRMQEARPGVPGGRLLGAMFLAGGVLVFCLGQLHLQFALKDVRRETAKQQARKLELKSEVNALRSEVESHKKGEKLLQYAEADLGMVRYPTGKWEFMTVAAEVQDRYREIEVARPAHDERTVHGERETAWAGRLAGKLEMATEAFAGGD